MSELACELAETMTEDEARELTEACTLKLEAWPALLVTWAELLDRTELLATWEDALLETCTEEELTLVLEAEELAFVLEADELILVLEAEDETLVLETEEETLELDVEELTLVLEAEDETLVLLETTLEVLDMEDELETDFFEYVLKEEMRQNWFANSLGFSATCFLHESTPLRALPASSLYMGQPEEAYALPAQSPQKLFVKMKR